MAKNKLIRFNSKSSPSKIDRENGIIYGVSVITANREAKGHELYVDETTIDQVVNLGKKTGDVGLKARFDHPSACGGSMGTAIGRFKDFRKQGEKAIADLHLLDAASKSPNGNYKDYILELAEEDPGAFSTSIVFIPSDHYEPTEKETKGLSENDPFLFPHTRIESLTHCDVVDEGAANDGLFGRPDYLAEQAEKWMNEKSDLVMSLLDKFFKKKNMKIETLAAQNNEVALKEMEEDLKKLQKENDELKQKEEALKPEIKSLYGQINESKIKENHSLAQLEHLQKEIEVLQLKVKELESFKLGESIVTIVDEKAITPKKTKYQVVEDKKSQMQKWLDEEKAEQLKTIKK